jgi:hypothetical protein
MIFTPAGRPAVGRRAFLSKLRPMEFNLHDNELLFALFPAISGNNWPV